MGDFLTTAQLEALEQAPSGASSSNGMLSTAQLEAMEKGIDPQFADVTSGSSEMQPPPPLAQRFHDALTFGDPHGYLGTFNPLDALGSIMGVAKAPINAAYRTGARAMGLPVGDEATPEGAIGEIVHPTGGAYPATDIYAAIANAAGNTINPLAPFAETLGPKAAEVSKGLTEKAAGMALDPASLLLAGGALPKAAHIAMQTGMAGGITTQGLEAVDEYKKNGISGKFLSHLANMGVDGLFMLSGHLSKKEMAEIEKSPEVKNTITPPPEVGEIDPAEIKMIDKITKAQDMEEIAKQRAATRAGNASDKEYARRVDKLADAQAREDIAAEKNRMKPPIEVEPLFPEGEIQKPEVQLADKLQEEQERYPNEERFKEAREKVKELEGGYPEEGEDTLEPDQIKLVDKINAAQAREEIRNQKNAQKKPLKLDPNEIVPPPNVDEEHLPVELRPSIQEAVQGFTPKTSIKNLQERLGVDETTAREVYWKTKKALSEEKQTGSLPLESIKSSEPSLTMTSEAMKNVSKETQIKAGTNPHLLKLKRWIENVFPEARASARRTLLGAAGDINRNKFTGLEYDPSKLGGRKTGKFKTPEGEVYSRPSDSGGTTFNPWTTAQEIQYQVKLGKISPSEAPAAFAQKLIHVLSHENAHVGRGIGHGGVNELGENLKNTGRYKEMDKEGYYDPESANKEFSFRTGEESVLNDPQRIEAMRGILSEVNAPALKEMYESILGDANQMGREMVEGKKGKSAYSKPIESKMIPFKEKGIPDSLKGTSVVDEEGLPKPVYHGTTSVFDTFDPRISPAEIGTHFGTKQHAGTRLERTSEIDEALKNSYAVGHRAPSNEPSNVGEYYLNIKKPIRLRDEGGFSAESVALQLHQRGIISAAQLREIENQPPSVQRKSVIAALEQRGYDGIKYINRYETSRKISSDEKFNLSDKDFQKKYGEGDSYIALYPEQIVHGFTGEEKAGNYPRAPKKGKPIESKMAPWFPEPIGAEHSGLTLDDIKPIFPDENEPLVRLEDVHNPFSEVDENGNDIESKMASSIPPSPRLGGPRMTVPSSNPTARLGGHPPSSPQGQALSVVQPPGVAAKAWEVFRKGVSAARALTVGGDVSSPFRQSWIQTFSHPIKSAKNISQMFKAMSEKGYEEISADIRKNPYFKEAVDSKLSLTKGLIENKPEEQFEGTKVIEDVLKKTHLEKLNIFSPTERAYTQYLNQTRMESFQRGMELLEGKYGRRSVPEASKRALAKYVNSSTGRGEFNSRSFEAAATTLNQVLFSPRLLKSRLDVFNPREWYRMAKTEPVVAKMAAMEIAKSAAFVGSMVAAAGAAGAKVEKDPRSPDFGKIRVGNHTIDPWGGYQQYLRYATQFALGQRKNQYGQIKEANRGDTLIQFGRSKLAPVPGFLYSAAKGTNMIGRRTSLTNPQSYIEAFAPMTFRDIYEVGKTDPVLAIAMALPISLGMGMTSREPLNAPKSVRDEYERLMVPPPSDVQNVQLRNKPKTIDPLTGRGKYESRKLTDSEFEKAKEEGDKVAFSEVEKYISSPSYQALPEEKKRIALNNISRKLGTTKRKLASQMVMSPPPK